MDLFKYILLRIEEEISPAPVLNRTHNLSVTRHALYCCVTTPTPFELNLIFHLCTILIKKSSRALSSLGNKLKLLQNLSLIS